MLQNLDNKQKAYGTLIIFGIIAYLFYIFSDGFSVWLSTTNAWLAMIVAIVLNPAYLLLIYWLYKEYDLRGIASGILISLAIDIISLTHSITNSAILPVDGTALPLYGYSDTTFFKLIMPYLHGTTALLVLYVVIPVVLMYLALRIIRRTASFNKILKEAM